MSFRSLLSRITLSRFQPGSEMGAVMHWVASSLIVMFGFAAFTFDFGMTYFEQRRIAFAVDAGAMAGALALTEGASSISEVKGKAMRVALANGLQSGSEIVQDADILVGSYDGTNFTVESDVDDANAVQVNSRRTVKSIFGNVFGVDSLYPKAQALAMMNITTTSSAACIRPFGVEDLNFPSVDFSDQATFPQTFDPPLTFTVGKNSPGNWGKVDIPDAQGIPVNMSSYPNFQSYMTGGNCGGPMTLGDPYTGGTGGAALKDSIEALLNEQIVMLIVDPFGNGNSNPINLHGYAVGKFLSVSDNGAGLDINIEISELRSEPGTITRTGVDSVTPRLLMY